MENIKEFYNFINDIWKYIKNTKAPEQDDNEAWDRINDMCAKMRKELAVKQADWMEMLREESLNGKTD